VAVGKANVGELRSYALVAQQGGPSHNFMCAKFMHELVLLRVKGLKGVQTKWMWRDIDTTKSWKSWESCSKL
jgi:hypothetical protein